MVAQHICKVLVFKGSEMRVDLVLLISLLEVCCDLRTDARLHLLGHVLLASFAEEQVLGLRHAKIVGHLETFLRKVCGGFPSRHLRHD